MAEFVAPEGFLVIINSFSELESAKYQHSWYSLKVPSAHAVVKLEGKLLLQS